jgi:multiple sugar transport system permease protein
LANLVEVLNTNNLNKKIPLNKRILKELKINGFAYIVVFAALVHFCIFKAFPFLSSFVLSFYKYKFGGHSKFIGLENWTRTLNDPIMWKSLANTGIFTLYFVIPSMIVGLILALLINAKVRNTHIFRVIYFLPVVTSFVVVAGIWKWIFAAQSDGIANFFLALIGIPPQIFLSDDKLALVVLAGLSIFKAAGSVMIYYFGGLKQIPESLYEAASIDGASGARQFFKITLPLLKPTTLFVAIMSTIGSFQVFDSAYLLTGGGPNYATSTIVYYIYKKAFVTMNFGEACSVSIILFVIILGISLIQKKLIGDDISYS